MCGRYGRRSDKQRIAEWFRTHNTNVFNDPELAPTSNAAPQTFSPLFGSTRKPASVRLP